MSKYADIAQDLRQKIKTGELAPGQPLPDQKTLAKHYHTSRMTLQKSLTLLKTEGYLYSQQGAATYVKHNAADLANMEVSVDQYVGTSKLLGKTHDLTSKIIRFKMRYPNDTEQEKLALQATQVIYDIIRVRYVDNVPYGIEYTKMPVDLIPGLDEEVLHHSIYSYIEETLELKIGAAFRQICAQKSSADDIKYLHNQPDDPVLAVTNIVYLNDGRPFEYSTTDQRFDKGHFSVFLPGRAD